MTTEEMLFQYCLRMGDTHNVFAHRMGEWCTNGHILEEDIAMTNIALDHIGSARAWLMYGAEVEGKGRTEDDLAYHRDERAYMNMLISELPNGNFADTIARNFMFDAFSLLYYSELANSTNETLAGIAQKVIKEARYHLKHSSNWMVRLGDGTEESHQKLQAAIEEVWLFTGNMFEMDEIDQNLADAGIGVDCAKIKDQWLSMVMKTVTDAKVTIPENKYMLSGSKKGIHTEALGHMLAEMQSLARAYPDAKW